VQGRADVVVGKTAASNVHGAWELVCAQANEAKETRA